MIGSGDLNLNVGSALIPSSLFLNSISEPMFQNNLPSEVKSSVEKGLINLVGKTPSLASK